MYKVIRTFLLFLFIHQDIQAQTNQTADALALKIPQTSTYSTSDIAAYIQQNFATDSARIRAIYVWITNNIQYDVAKLRAHKNNPEASSDRQSVPDVLKNRRAVCQGYAELFVELCNNMGINAHLVGGYTKKAGVVGSLPHAWVGAELGGTWYLFDPTWGAGYVKEDQFIRSPNNHLYKVAPAVMIKDHMPFDPMYQFLTHTINNKEFINGQTAVNTTKPYFNFVDTLKQFVLLSPQEKINSEKRRLEASGIQNELLLDRLNYLKKGTEPFAFNDANAHMKKAVMLFNQYIDQKNKQFSAIDDKTLQQITDSISYHTQQARTLLQNVMPRQEAQKQMVANMYEQMEKFQLRAIKEKEFVTTYLRTDKSSRRQLFGKR